MGWFRQRARRRRQAELDAITKRFDLDNPEAIAQYERDVETARRISAAERRRRELEGHDARGQEAGGCASIGVPHQSPETEASPLSAAQYKEFITGYSAHIYYRCEDPSARYRYDFDGFVDGHLIWTIADRSHKFDDDGPREGGIDQAYLDSARVQDLARGRHPLMWCVQYLSDAAQLRALLNDAGVTSIVVRHATSGPG